MTSEQLAERVGQFGDGALAVQRQVRGRRDDGDPGRAEGAPQRGQGTTAQPVAAPSGEAPFGFRSRPSLPGSRTGNSDSGTGTSPQASQ